MLLLVFRLGSDRYAIPTGQIIEVLPPVAWHRVPQAPDVVMGVIDYRGDPVPLLDLQQLALGIPTPLRRGTRILLVAYPIAPGVSRPLGLLVQDATAFLRRDAGEFEDSPVRSAPRYVGPVTRDEGGFVQRLELTELVPLDLWQRLLDAPATPGARTE